MKKKKKINEKNLIPTNQILCPMFMKVKDLKGLFEKKEQFVLGGFKTWECSHDLVTFLKSIVNNYQDETTVLEVREKWKGEMFSKIILT